MKVTDIKKSVNSKFDIYIDFEYAFSLYESEIKKNKLKKDSDLNEEEYKKLIENIKKSALNSALKMILRCDYTSKMIEEKLLIKKYPKEAIEFAVSYLKENNYVDDNMYAKRFAKNAFENKKKGRAYVKAQLLRRGIEKEVIQELTEKYYNDDEIISIAEKKYKSIKKDKEKLDIKDLNKLKNYLLRQGFSFDEIMKAVEAVKGNYEY